MSLAAIRTELKTVIEAVSGIGNVYDYLRYSNSEKNFKDLFKADKKINGWQITRQATSEETESQNYNNIRTHKFLIWGIYSAKDVDASEKTFQDLVEAVTAALRTAGKSPQPLSGTALYVEPPQVEKIEYRCFGGVLVHSVDISVEVTEYVTF